jgi:hypothetical protein
MMRKKSSYSFLRSLVKGQDLSFFKNLTGVFCTVGGSLVDYDVMLHINAPKPFRFETNMFQKQRKCNKLNRKFKALSMNMEFISFVRQDFYDIFTRALHS